MSSAPAPATVADIWPGPTQEEVAAITAAIDATWPRPGIMSAGLATRPSTWRWSGRWWARPVAARRDRPWH